MGDLRAYLVTRGESDAGGGQFSEVGVDEALARLDDPAVWPWFDLGQPAAEDFDPLREPLGLHPLAVEDALAHDQVAKTEEYPAHTFILFSRWTITKHRPKIEQLSFFVGDGYLLSVHPDAAESEFAAHLREAAERDATTLGHGPDRLLAVLLDHVVDGKLETIEAVEEVLDRTEERLLTDNGELKPTELVRLRRRLLRLRKSLVYEREVISRLVRHDSPHISEDVSYAFRDISDHLVQFYEMLEIARELLSSVTEMHLGMVNNRIAVIGNETNFVMRRLTIISVIFMPLTLLSGILGMSEYTVMTGGEGNMRLAYPMLIGLMFVLALVSYALLKRLDRRDDRQPAPNGEGEP